MEKNKHIVVKLKLYVFFSPKVQVLLFQEKFAASFFLGGDTKCASSPVISGLKSPQFPIYKAM